MADNCISLDNLPINKYAEIKNINIYGSTRTRLLDLGLVNGTSIVPVLKSPLGDPTAYRIRGAMIALRKEDSKLIKVKEK